MIYYFEERVLEVVATLFSGSVNDVLVCRDTASPVGTTYTLWVIHDHDCIKKLLPIWESCDTEAPYLFSFAQNDELIYGFPFRTERRFSSFAKGQMAAPSVGETICTNLVVECISCPFPYPLLHLMLSQNNVHITKENEIYFTCALDLSQLDDTIGERECAIRCAQMILELLEGVSKKKGRELKSFELIRRKIKSNSYNSFAELYRDICLTSMPGGKLSIKARLQGWWLRNKDTLFKWLLVLCIIAAVVALIMLISQLIYGDIPLLRLLSTASM